MSLIKRPPLRPDQFAKYYPPAPPERSASGSPVRAFAAPVTRYRPDFDTKGRLEVAGKTYELVGVSPLKDTYRKTYLTLHAQAANTP